MPHSQDSTHVSEPHAFSRHALATRTLWLNRATHFAGEVAAVSTIASTRCCGLQGDVAEWNVVVKRIPDRQLGRSWDTDKARPKHASAA